MKRIGFFLKAIDLEVIREIRPFAPIRVENHPGKKTAPIYFGNPEAVLYFDRFSCEPPLAPYGFPCMGGYFPFGPP